MAGPKLVPDPRKMREYRNKGMTQRQIAEAWEAESGIRVSRNAIGMAMARYGIEPTHPQQRYDALIPWKVREKHLHHYAARMLRLEGRRRAGKRLSQSDAKKLASWKAWLEEPDLPLAPNGKVVLYDPQTEDGWFYIPRDPERDDDIIRRPLPSTSAPGWED